HHRAEAVVEAAQLNADDVPLLRPLAMRQVEGPRHAQLVRGGDAAAQDVPGTVVHLARPARALVEPPLLALGELTDALAVELDGSGDGHAAMVARAPGAGQPPRRLCHEGIPLRSSRPHV